MMFATDALDSESKRLREENKAEAFMEGWTGRDGKAADLRNLFHAKSWYLSDGSVVINKTLPKQIRPESTINFCTHNVFYDAYVNGVLMDSYHPEPNTRDQATARPITAFPSSRTRHRARSSPSRCILPTPATPEAGSTRCICAAASSIRKSC